MLLGCPTHRNDFAPLSAVSIRLFLDHSFLNILFHQPRRHLPCGVRALHRARKGQTEDGEEYLIPRIKVRSWQMFSYPTNAKTELLAISSNKPMG